MTYFEKKRQGNLNSHACSYPLTFSKMISRKRMLSLAAKAKKMKRQQLKVHHDQLQNITQTWCLFAVKTSCWCVPTLNLAEPHRPQTDSSCLTAVNHHLSCHSIQLLQLNCLWSWPQARNTIWTTNLRPPFVLSEAFHLVVLITVWYPRLSETEASREAQGQKKIHMWKQRPRFNLQKKHFCSSHKKSCNYRL